MSSAGEATRLSEYGLGKQSGKFDAEVAFALSIGMELGYSAINQGRFSRLTETSRIENAGDCLWVGRCSSLGGRLKLVFNTLGRHPARNTEILDSMISPISILFLVIARGGSKGVSGKNLRQIGGQTLVGFKAVSARKSKYCTRLMLSTESPEIAEEGRRLGVEVPFMRPMELATDKASSGDVVLHAMEWIEKTEGRSYDAVMLLEPAAPFATAADYDRAVELFMEREANLVVGMREVEVPSHAMGTLGADGSIATIVEKILNNPGNRRQDFDIEYTMNGALYLLRWDWFKQVRKVYCDVAHSYGVVMDRFHSVEIDNPVDLAMAQFLVTEGHLDMSHWTNS